MSWGKFFHLQNPILKIAYEINEDKNKYMPEGKGGDSPDDTRAYLEARLADAGIENVSADEWLEALFTLGEAHRRNAPHIRIGEASGILADGMIHGMALATKYGKKNTKKRIFRKRNNEK